MDSKVSFKTIISVAHITYVLARRSGTICYD